MKNKNKLKKIALERIKILFDEADEMFNESQELANKYIRTARKIAMKVNLSMPRQFKRRYCKYCYSYFKAGKNYRVRVNKGKVVYYCFNCKKFTRIPYTKEKLARKRKK